MLIAVKTRGVCKAMHHEYNDIQDDANDSNDDPYMCSLCNGVSKGDPTESASCIHTTKGGDKSCCQTARLQIMDRLS